MTASKTGRSSKENPKADRKVKISKSVKASGATEGRALAFSMLSEVPALGRAVRFAQARWYACPAHAVSEGRKGVMEF